jgi:hypothetical protein
VLGADGGRVTAEDRRQALRDGSALFEQSLRWLGRRVGSVLPYEVLLIASTAASLRSGRGLEPFQLIRAAA